MTATRIGPRGARGPRQAMSVAEWSDRTERASLALREPLLAQALENYERLDDAAQKMQLTYEVAQTRGAELTLAYDNVVMVASGPKPQTPNPKPQTPNPKPLILQLPKSLYHC